MCLYNNSRTQDQSRLSEGMRAPLGIGLSYEGYNLHLGGFVPPDNFLYVLLIVVSAETSLRRSFLL